MTPLCDISAQLYNQVEKTQKSVVPGVGMIAECDSDEPTIYTTRTNRARCCSKRSSPSWCCCTSDGECLRMETELCLKWTRAGDSLRIASQGFNFEHTDRRMRSPIAGWLSMLRNNTISQRDCATSLRLIDGCE